MTLPGPFFRRTLLFMAALFSLVVSGTAFGQLTVGAPNGPQAQAALGVIPGFGLQAAHVTLRSIYTREVVFYADVLPSLGGEGSVQISGSAGGALRILGIGRTLGNSPYNGYDVDVGLRVGPSLFFAFNETRSSKNQRFSLFLEPFARASTRLTGGRLLFLELGVQRPLLRGGFWIPL